MSQMSREFAQFLMAKARWVADWLMPFHYGDTRVDFELVPTVADGKALVMVYGLLDDKMGGCAIDVSDARRLGGSDTIACYREALKQACEELSDGLKQQSNVLILPSQNGKG